MASDEQSQKKVDPKKVEVSDRTPLPFEPARKKSSKPAAAVKRDSQPRRSASVGSERSASSDIPEVVNRRMLKRMALFCGIPTFLGVATFFVSYFVITRGLFTLPHTAVLLVSLGFFGLGVVGLSYGALSASWDEDHPGSALGLAEFRTNFGRLTGAWKEAGEQKRQSKGS